MATPAAPVNPVIQGIGTAIDLGTGIIGAILSYGANKREAQKADRAAGVQEREAIRANRFSESMSEEGLRLQKKTFGLNAMQVGTNITKDAMSRVEELLNKNTALKNRVLQIFSMY